MSNKKILITGASSGIGEGVAIECSRNNYATILVARNEERLKHVSDKCVVNAESVILAGDLNNVDFIENIAQDCSLLDGVVLNAGVINYRPITMISSKNINDIMGINFNSNVILIQNLLKYKKINEGASIVLMGSISSHFGLPGTALYASSKAAITTYAKVMASELASRKIRVNVISAGLIKTKMFENFLHYNSSDEQIAKQYPLGIGSIEDVTNLVLFCLSEKSTWITGADIVIDGGFSISKG
jgi:NAD(P)-dependent dehydrogenase (short-subunit alcohol dehydrogenase family)